MVGRTYGGWELVKRLGEGTTAVVYEGRHPDTAGSRAAVKILTREAEHDEEFLSRFRREAELAASLDHPHLVKVMACGREHGSHFLVMELVDGGSLESLLDRSGSLPWEESCRIVSETAQALGYAWAQRGVVHRDLKPANILLTAERKAKLADLGFAKQITSSNASAEGLTMAGTSLGSPSYMPPEQVTDAKLAGPSADVYGLAATLFHTVTGKLPFDGRTAHHIMERVLNDPVPSIRSIKPELPVALDALLMWSMHKDPLRRPSDVGAFANALALVCASPDDAAVLAPLRERQPEAGMPVWIWVAGAVVVAALAIAAMLVLREHA